MSEDWYYSTKGTRLGPVAPPELKRLADSGQLLPTDLVWKEGLKNWVAASKVKGLFAIPAGPPPLPQGGSAAASDGDLRPKIDAAAKAATDVAQAAMQSIAASAEDLRPKIGVAAKAAADVAQAAVQSIAASKPIAGFHIQRAGLGVAAIIGALTTFMPWLTAPIVGTVYGTAGDGWGTLALFIPALVLTWRGDRLQPIGGVKRFVAAVPPAIASMIGIWKIVDINMRLSKMNSDMAGNPFGTALARVASTTTQTGIGLYLLVLSGAAAAAAVFLLKSKNEKVSL
ncbi:MAG: DUF4339 domain-containing protein [Betaproteobacteria bacterium]|nr:DUF4339 domain-containing protein [Betaproteobacteria bacterium]